MLNSEFVHCMRTAFNLFMPNRISYCYQLKQSISVLRDVRWYFSFNSNSSLVMPIGDPWDGFFYPTLILMSGSYILTQDKISDILIRCARKIIMDILFHSFLIEC